MSSNSNPKIEDVLRETILTRPDVILDDKDLMHALIAANERAMGGNIIDLRGLAMERLEARLDRLEDTHRSVIAAAYENLAGTNLIHRAILRMLEPAEFESFLRDLGGDVAEILRVDVVRLVLEAPDGQSVPALQRLEGVLKLVEPGFIDRYVGPANGSGRAVTLRQVQSADPAIYAKDGDWIRSEACLRLDFGKGLQPALLVFGAEDPHMFGPQQGTDLLAFFAGVFERSMRRWLG